MTRSMSKWPISRNDMHVSYIYGRLLGILHSMCRRISLLVAIGRTQHSVLSFDGRGFPGLHAARNQSSTCHRSHSHFFPREMHPTALSTLSSCPLSSLSSRVNISHSLQRIPIQHPVPSTKSAYIKKTCIPLCSSPSPALCLVRIHLFYQQTCSPADLYRPLCGKGCHPPRSKVPTNMLRRQNFRL